MNGFARLGGAVAPAPIAHSAKESYRPLRTGRGKGGGRAAIDRSRRVERLYGAGSAGHGALFARRGRQVRPRADPAAFEVLKKHLCAAPPQPSQKLRLFETSLPRTGRCTLMANPNGQQQHQRTHPTMEAARRHVRDDDARGAAPGEGGPCGRKILCRDDISRPPQE